MNKEQYLKLKSEIDEYKKECEDNFPLKKGDYVEFEARPKTENKEAEIHFGFVNYIFFDEKRGEAKANIKDRRSAKWISLGDRTTFYLEDMGKTIKKIENPVSTDMVDDLERELYALEEDKEISRGEFATKKTEIQNKISELRKKCIHKWIKGNFIKEKRTTFGGMTDIHEFTCENCGLIKEE